MARGLDKRRSNSKRTLRAESATALPDAAPHDASARAASRESAPTSPGTLPSEVARQSQRQMDRLRRLPAGSPEAAQVRAYLHWLWSMPWDRRVRENVRLDRVERSLDESQLGMVRSKQRILEYLAVRRLKPDLPGPALCLVGPPGTGKSSLGAAVASALNRPFARISVSGTSNAAELVGVARTSPGAQPGRIVQALREAGSLDPVLMIDGVDRLTGEASLGVIEVLLDLLDPDSNQHFTDQYLGMPVDLSHAVLILCANQSELVPDALSERLETIEVPGYGEDEKIEIARRFLVPKQLTEHGLTTRDVTLADETLRVIVRHYTLEAGVRGLARQIATVFRKVARARVGGDRHKHVIEAEKLHDYLGPRLHAPEMVGQEDEVGVAMGLAWTVAGGEILVIEALKMPGTGRIVLTGHLGEVMRESVQAAHSYVRSRATSMGIPEDSFSNFDIHIHFPAAGVPKDGPSAGITVGLVIASVLSERPIRHDLALTGEVSLRGKVLAVGGMREKTLAAYRAGFRGLVFPAHNIKDLADVPVEVLEHLELLPVSGMDEVLMHALSPIVMPQKIGDVFVIDDPNEAIDEAPGAAQPRDVPGLE